MTRTDLERDFIVLGAGVAGLAAASELGESCTVFEREDRPGGLVRTDCIDGYWFDRVLHLLHFQDDAMERRMRDLLGDALVRLSPEAWVETRHGTVRFPFQLHLAGLAKDVRERCLSDFVVAASEHNDEQPRNFEEMLLRTFGREMCDVFLFPYNRKLWKRPLAALAPSGFQWNITRPDVESVARGAASIDARAGAYNSNGWYPRPRADAPQRGMAVLSEALAARVADLQLEHEVQVIDPVTRSVVVRHRGRDVRARYRQACLATLPLSRLLSMVSGAPADLVDACRRLHRNRVISVMVRVAGPRPSGQGLWRYYADESIVFTRLIFMHEFDPLSAPEHGWGLMAEITEPAEQPLADSRVVIRRVIEDIARARVLSPECGIVGATARVVDPAYVVFDLASADVVAEALAFLRSCDVIAIGRYGKWEYSSMAQVMRDGFAWAESVAAREKPA
ncbi:MAG TPA: FAD-dependent oxidoreductase [Candidatus Krumholzibacteria bacterium]|nr:FAD-dependent oxidoreductase [Candidatus Krumholzibacteria bacterium]